MAGSHRVEVELLHQDNISAHILAGQRPPALGMMFVTVYPAHHQALAVKRLKSEIAQLELNDLWRTPSAH